MPPTGAVKSDINRAGREAADFPSVCENCLGSNPYIQMIKEEQGMECKICTRPFTVFRWSADRSSRFKKTNICLTCARLKNCCQCCMLDLSFGLPIAVRDAALKLVAQGPNSDINKQYYAQNNEGALQNGDIPEEYEKTDAAARDLLKRLATSEPYYRRRRTDDEDAGESGQRRIGGPGPIRTERGRGRGGARGRGRGRGGRFPNVNQVPVRPEDVAPPEDPTITSLFLTGVEDDLAEHHLRTFFSAFGGIKSLVCVHRSHCAFVNFAERVSAEAAAASCQGRAVISGCPLRVQWGKPRPIGNLDSKQASELAHVAQSSAVVPEVAEYRKPIVEEPLLDISKLPKAPGSKDDTKYPSQLAHA